MIPIGDSPRPGAFPFVNVALIVTNVLVFLYEVQLSNQPLGLVASELDRFIAEWANIPACTFDALGWETNHSVRALRVCEEQPQPVLTIFTAMFMHGSWLHLLGNMLFLWIFGDNVEAAMGHIRYAIFYLLAGTLAAIAHGLVNASDLTPAVGASGAIAGVLGAYLLLFPRATATVVFFPIIIPLPIPAFVLIGFWFVTQVFSGLAELGRVDDAVGSGGGIAYFAHIGGFVAGALLVNLFVLGRERYVRLQTRRRDRL
jgi:membrane associated rhomboid family serine protease